MKRLSNRTIIIGVGLIVFIAAYLLMSGPSAGASGFQAGQRIGYIAGYALLAAAITWAVLKYVLHRK